MNIQRISLNLIRQVDNSRLNYRHKDMADLMRSMKDNDLLHPIGVRKSSEGDYVVVYGNRRFLAAKKLGWSDIEANLIESDNTADLIIKNLEENLHRKNVNLFELGRAYLELFSLGLSMSEASARTGQSITTIKAAIQTVDRVPDNFKNKVTIPSNCGSRKNGNISPTSLLNLSSIARESRLTKKEFENLLTYAAKDGVDLLQIKRIPLLLKQGLDLEEAINKADSYKVVNLKLLMEKSNIASLEKKYGSSISEIILDTLEETKLFRILRKTSLKKSNK